MFLVTLTGFWGTSQWTICPQAYEYMKFFDLGLRVPHALHQIWVSFLRKPQCNHIHNNHQGWGGMCGHWLLAQEVASALQLSLGPFLDSLPIVDGGEWARSWIQCWEGLFIFFLWGWGRLKNVGILGSFICLCTDAFTYSTHSYRATISFLVLWRKEGIRYSLYLAVFGLAKRQAKPEAVNFVKNGWSQ